MTAIHLEGATLFAPYNATATSQDAARRVLPKVGTQMAQVYAVIVVGKEVTEPEIEQATGLPGNSVRPRLWSLQGNGPSDRPKPPALIEVCGVRDGHSVYRAVKAQSEAA